MDCIYRTVIVGLDRKVIREKTYELDRGDGIYEKRAYALARKWKRKYPDSLAWVEVYTLNGTCDHIVYAGSRWWNRKEVVYFDLEYRETFHEIAAKLFPNIVGWELDSAVMIIEHVGYGYFDWIRRWGTTGEAALEHTAHWSYESNGHDIWENASVSSKEKWKAFVQKVIAGIEDKINGN